MSWAKIDDAIAFHPKVIRAGNEAFGAWVRMLAHSCAMLTDGFVADEILKSITRPTIVTKLLMVGLVDPAQGGVSIHDFHEWNPPSEEVRTRRETERARKLAGRRQQSRDPKTGKVVSGESSHNSPSVRPDNSRTSERNPAGRPPVPSRPVPSRPISPLSPPEGARPSGVETETENPPVGTRESKTQERLAELRRRKPRF